MVKDNYQEAFFYSTVLFSSEVETMQIRNERKRKREILVWSGVGKLPLRCVVFKGPPPQPSSVLWPAGLNEDDIKSSLLAWLL